MSEDRRPTVLDLFSGIGGFSLGLDRAGWRTVGFCEIDDFCNRVLERHWPGVPRWRDVRHLALPHAAGEQQPVGAGSPDSVDLVCAGWPCQDHSVAGRRAGLAGARSGLFYELVRVARALRPRWLLLENVPGLLSSSGGDDFRAVLAALGECGYGVGWRVLDARHFGVPQRRRRVFLVGRLGAPCPPEVLALSEGLPGHPPPGGEAGADVARCLRGGAQGGRTSDDPDRVSFVPLPVATGQPRRYRKGPDSDATDTLIPTASHDVSPPLRAEGHDASEDGRGRRAFAFSYLDDGGDAQQDVVPTLRVGTTMEKHRGRAGSGAVAFTQNQRDELRLLDDLAGALASQEGMKQRTYLADRPAIRRLTPTECARLQGFPDDWNCLCGVQPYSTWTCVCADGPRYASYGNAVCVPVVEWLGARLLAAHEAGR